MGDINTIFKLSCNPALVTEITKARCKLQGMGYIVAVVRVSAHKGDYANYVADAVAKAGSKMKEVVEPKLDRRCELVKVLVDGNWGKSGRMRSWEELPGDVRVMTQFVTERMEARELADIGSDVGATTKGRYPLIDRSGIGGPPLIPEEGGHDRALLGKLRSGGHESGGSGRRLNAVGVQVLIASGKALLSGRMRCPVCGRAGDPSVAHVVLGECSAGATSGERCEIVRSMERSANAYPWSYNEEEDGGERTEDWTDDEEEGERRLREIWDDEVEREGGEVSGKGEESGDVGEWCDEEGDDDDLGRDTYEEDAVERILGERRHGNDVEVKVCEVPGASDEW